MGKSLDNVLRCGLYLPTHMVEYMTWIYGIPESMQGCIV
jgi:hypothetical protein